MLFLGHALAALLDHRAHLDHLYLLLNLSLRAWFSAIALGLDCSRF